MFYKVIPGETVRYIAMAKRVPFTSETPSPLTEPGDLWIQIGDTAAEALSHIQDDMIKQGLEKDVVLCDGGDPKRR